MNDPTPAFSASALRGISRQRFIFLLPLPPTPPPQLAVVGVGDRVVGTDRLHRFEAPINRGGGASDLPGAVPDEVTEGGLGAQVATDLPLGLRRGRQVELVLKGAYLKNKFE